MKAPGYPQNDTEGYPEQREGGAIDQSVDKKLQEVIEAQINVHGCPPVPRPIAGRADSCERKVGSGNVEVRQGLDVAAVVVEQPHRPLRWRVLDRVQRQDTGRVGIATIDALERWVALQCILQLSTVIYVASLSRPPPHQIPYIEDVLVIVRGVEVRRLTVGFLELVGKDF